MSTLRLDNAKVDIALVRKGWDNQDLARAAGLSNARVTQARYHVKCQCPSTVGKFAKALDVDVSDILQGVSRS